MNNIKQNKWDKLSNNSQHLLNYLESNINNKIYYYKEKIKNQKEELNISDILGDYNIDNNDIELQNQNTSNEYSEVSIDCERLPQVDNYYECTAKTNSTKLLGYSFYLNGRLYKSISATSGNVGRISLIVEKDSTIYATISTKNSAGGYGGESKSVKLNYEK